MEHFNIVQTKYQAECTIKLNDLWQHITSNDDNYSKLERQVELEKIGSELNIEKLALTFVPSFSDKQSEVYLNRINPEAKNTIIIYRNRNIIGKFINLNPTQGNKTKVSKILDETRNKYFELAEPKHE